MKRAWISQSVLVRIRQEAEKKAPLETGGLLIGYVSTDDDDVVITDMIGPGPRAKHLKWTFRPDYIHHRKEVARIFDESEGDLTYLGDWHSHPSAPSYLSFLDKHALRNIARFPGNHINRPIMMVLGGVDREKRCVWTPCVWRISPITPKFLWLGWEYIPLDFIVFEATNAIQP